MAGGAGPKKRRQEPKVKAKTDKPKKVVVPPKKTKTKK